MLLGYVSADGLKNDEVVSLENILVISSPSSFTDDMLSGIQSTLEALEWEKIQIKIVFKDDD